VTPAFRAGGWVLAAAFLALHLPSLPASLEDVDSINFALGVRDFDVANHQPHPPGYPLVILAAKGVNAFVGNEAHALSLLNIVAGALTVIALTRLFSAAVALPQAFGLAAALLTVSAPLFWVTAGRPLSDVAGLAAAVAVQARLARATSARDITVAGAWAGLAAGIRSQVVWLTVPLLAIAWFRISGAARWRTAAGAAGAYAAGAAAWAIPLVVLTGGPALYWRALSSQGAEDLSGVTMLWTTPTPRQAVWTLYYAFVAPWGAWPLAAIVLVLAAAGAARLLTREPATSVVLVAGFGPYMAFDLLFQEAVTTRYALPLVVPVAFLAVRGAAMLPARAAITVVVVLAAAGATIGQSALYAYSRSAAPAFRLLADMAAPSESARPVLAMHFDLRRAFTWKAEELPRLTALPAPPYYEWLEAVKYWNGGGRAPVWFAGNPLRTDFALIDRPPARGRYDYGLPHRVLFGGVRPGETVWYSLDKPGWYLGEGWALTPETAGIARRDHKGPGIAPIEGWIRRASAATVMYGGRNLNGGPARVTLTIDGRAVDGPTVGSGFFLRMLALPPASVSGPGDYARMTISAEAADGAAAAPPDVAIEQFDAEPSGNVIFGFGEGWHEHEYDPSTGQLWRWTSDRAALRVRTGGRAVVLTLAGETDALPRNSRVVVRAGNRVVTEASVGREFALRTTIPAELLGDGESAITIETDQSTVPAETQSGTEDRRRLGLKIYECRLTPVS
jgi:hypothetical protein